MQRPMVTANEAARILRVTRQTVRAMIERGELEGFSRGKLTRVTAESLERLMHGHSSPLTEMATAGRD